MDKIEWCVQFNSGISELDAENRNLLDMINSLIEIQNAEEKDLQSLSFLLSQIQDYALRHFSHEESYMMQAHQEDFSDHKKQHIFFKKNLATFCFDMFTNQDETSLDSFCEYLAKWFVFHTANFDKHIAVIYHENAPKF